MLKQWREEVAAGALSASCAAEGEKAASGEETRARAFRMLAMN